MPSFGMFSARAAMMAARSRAFIDGSGRPSLAETVISRASLPNSFDLAASCRPLRCMMFLNWECPAMISSAMRGPARPIRGAARAAVEIDAGVILRLRRDGKQSPECRPRLFEPPAKPHGADMAGKSGGVVCLDRDGAQRRRP